MKLLARLENSKNFWFLSIASFIFFLLRLPSLFEPYWYGDEGIYQVVGMALRSGRLLYRDIFDNKPPLLYLLYSLFNSDQFSLRLVSLIFGIFSVIVFFFLVKKIFSSSKNLKISYILILTFVFTVLFGIPLLEGNIANAENFMLLPILISALLIINFSQKIQQNLTKQIFLAGLLLGLAFLFKIVAIFDLGAFSIFLLSLNLQKIKNLFTKTGKLSDFKEVFLLLLGFFIPFFLTSLFFLAKGAFPNFLTAVFSSNIDYIAYANKLGIPQGFLVLKMILLFLFICFLFLKNKKLKREEIFVLLWFGFSLFNAFFSGRPYTHYLLVLLPSFSLMFGFLFLKKGIRKISFILLAVFLAVILSNFPLFGYKKTLLYYDNFISFVVGRKTVSDYQSFFDRRTPTDYEIVQFIKSQSDDKNKVFIWGNNAQVYKMLGVLPPGKYIVEYHIVGYKDGLNNTKLALEKTKPKFIVIMQNQPAFPFSLANYLQQITINNTSIYERIF